MTTVAKEGNERVGDMNSDDLTQCIQGVMSFQICFSLYILLFPAPTLML